MTFLPNMWATMTFWPESFNHLHWVGMSGAWFAHVCWLMWLRVSQEAQQKNSCIYTHRLGYHGKRKQYNSLVYHRDSQLPSRMCWSWTTSNNCLCSFYYTKHVHAYIILKGLWNVQRFTYSCYSHGLRRPIRNNKPDAMTKNARNPFSNHFNTRVQARACCKCLFISALFRSSGYLSFKILVLARYCVRISAEALGLITVFSKFR